MLLPHFLLPLYKNEAPEHPSIYKPKKHYVHKHPFTATELTIFNSQKSNQYLICNKYGFIYKDPSTGFQSSFGKTA
jgi:hypothetical protein